MRINVVRKQQSRCSYFHTIFTTLSTWKSYYNYIFIKLRSMEMGRLGTASLLFILIAFATSSQKLKPVQRACNLPDGIDKNLYVVNCNNADPLQLHSAAILKPDGSADYPISVKTPIRIFVNETNSGPSLNKVYADANVYVWTRSFFYCGWVALPTFGLLGNIDGCAIGGCPVETGTHIINTVYDITQFSQIIQYLANGVSLKVEVHLKDGTNPNAKEIGCIRLEGSIAA